MSEKKKPEVVKHEQQKMSESEFRETGFVFNVSAKIGPDGEVVDGSQISCDFKGNTEILANVLLHVAQSNDTLKHGIIAACGPLLKEFPMPTKMLFIQELLKTT